MPSNLFQNSSYIFSKSGRNSRDNWRVCTSQGGYLVSIETEEDWQFINDKIQNVVLRILVRGLWKRDGVWIWDSPQQLNISKWRDSKPDGNDACAEISKNGGLFISCCDKYAYICEMLGGKITFQP